MAVVDVGDRDLDPPGSADDLPVIHADTTLRQASVAILESASGRVQVADGSRIAGTLTFDGVRRILSEQTG